MTYAKLINNISNEQAQKLVNYILPWHLEKVIDLITQDKLDKLFNENPNNLSLEELAEQELKKLSKYYNEDISDEWFENIIILAGEEKFAAKLDIIPNENLVSIISNISNDKLATIISHASDESIVRIININLPKILPWLPFEKIKRITTLMDDEEVVEQLERQGAEQYKSF